MKPTLNNLASLVFAFSLGSCGLLFYLFNYAIKSEYNIYDFSNIYSDRIQFNSSDQRAFDDVIDRLANFNNQPELTISYESTHAQIVFNRTSDRVVFYQPWSVGYGNLIYSLISAFAIAVLTESALLVDWPAIENYIEPPLNRSFCKFNDSSALDMTSQWPPIHKIVPITPNSFSYQKHMILDVELPSDYERFYLSHWTAFFFDLCMNPYYAEKLVYMKLVRKQTVLLALKSLRDSDIVQTQKLEYLLQIGFEFAGSFLNKHWRLKPEVRASIESYVDNEFANSYLIGMQVRFIYLDKTDVRSFVECAQEIERRKKSAIGNRTVRWFISSDETEFLREIEAEYQDKITSGYGKLAHIQESQDAYGRTLLDIEMLAKCDEVILTGGSTFGFVASMMTQKKPYYVEGKRGLEGTCGVFRFSAPARRQEGYGMF